MNVKDLKEKLKDWDDNLIVYLEGCDCDAEWTGGIEYYKYMDGTKTIKLKRKGTGGSL